MSGFSDLVKGVNVLRLSQLCCLYHVQLMFGVLVEMNMSDGIQGIMAYYYRGVSFIRDSR